MSITLIDSILMTLLCLSLTNLIFLLMAYFGFSKGETKKNLLNILIVFLIMTVFLFVFFFEYILPHDLTLISSYLYLILLFLLFISSLKMVLDLNNFSANFGFNVSTEGTIHFFNLKNVIKITNKTRSFSILLILSIVLIYSIITNILMTKYVPLKKINLIQVFPIKFYGLLTTIIAGLCLVTFLYTKKKSVLMMSIGFLITSFSKSVQLIVQAYENYFGVMLGENYLSLSIFLHTIGFVIIIYSIIILNKKYISKGVENK